MIYIYYKNIDKLRFFKFTMVVCQEHPGKSSIIRLTFGSGHQALSILWKNRQRSIILTDEALGEYLN